MYALVGREINPNTIAALLTILGYSLYDTVVVFHRISDNMQHSEIKCTFMTMANHSMNQVFMRSINTTLTSIIPVLAMLLFGSETLKDFAFAMTIGLLAGAYSSIAIACPLFAIWKTRESKNVRLVKKYGAAIMHFEFARGASSDVALAGQNVADSSAAGARNAAADKQETSSEGAPTASNGELPHEASHKASQSNASAQGGQNGTSSAHSEGASASKAKNGRVRYRKDAAHKKAALGAKRDAQSESDKGLGAPDIKIVDREKFDDLGVDATGKETE